jgi:hypothetical protein
MDPSVKIIEAAAVQLFQHVFIAKMNSEERTRFIWGLKNLICFICFEPFPTGSNKCACH